MQTIRAATIDDAALIAAQRVQMFQDNGLACVETWETLAADSTAWTARHLADRSYVGWIVEDGGAVVGGAGVWFMEWPPHFMHVEPVRGYLLNFYVAPAARGRGLARQLVDRAIAECARRGVHVAVLHASAMGKPVYDQLGFTATNEMMRRL